MFDDAQAQRGQLPDLARGHHLTVGQRQLAGAAVARAVVIDDLIGLLALAQRAAGVPDLSAAFLLARLTQRFGRGLGQRVAGGRATGVAAVE